MILYYVILELLYNIIYYMWYSCFSEIFESLRDENRPRPETWAERKGAGVLGPTKADWGQAWLSLAPSAANRSAFGPNLA